MERQALAAQLVAGDASEQEALLQTHAARVDRDLVYALKAVFDDTKHRDPARAAAAAAVLEVVARLTADPEAGAVAAWTTGIMALMEGRNEEAIARLEDAEARYLHLGDPATAAATQVAKLPALALLGRYHEALACGMRVRTVLLDHGDTLAAGKVEQNLGNIYFRRDQYREAEALYRAARDRFVTLEDQTQLAQIDNCLATTLSAQHRFLDAAAALEQALKRAEAAGLATTQAEIECNLGCLWLFQGRYDRALDYLERSRRRYDLLGAPHDSAIAEQELADAYLELNLLEDAAAIYARVIPIFAELEMGAEQARALAYHGRACLLLGRREEARRLLDAARAIYTDEDNVVGAATVMLDQAQLLLTTGDAAQAERVAATAEAPLAAAGASGRRLLARWLRGEAARIQGNHRTAQAQLSAILEDIEATGTPQVAWHCHTSLGLLALAAGDPIGAERSFRQAVAIIEDLRAPLPADEFRTAFLADKLVPYTELVRLCLQDGRAERVVEALQYTERARSRALVDMLHGALPMRSTPQDAFEAELVQRLEAKRAELNWLYSQLDRPAEGDPSRAGPTMGSRYNAVREGEATVQRLTRQLRQCDAGGLVSVEPLEIADLQHTLGPETALVEYWSLDGKLLAFVVTDETVEVVRDLGHEAEVEERLDDLRFQLDTLQYGIGRIGAHLPQLTVRARHCLGSLFDLLLRPIIGALGTRRLVVVPHRMLHYVPFHALYDGERYVIEDREVCYAPSAGVLRHSLAMPQRPLRHAVLLGVPDAQIPGVRDEVRRLAPLFPNPVVLLDGHATLTALRQHAPAADVLHLACHGQFRPDNPLFSAVRLADGWLTVYDTYTLSLSAALVTLSACETGVSAVVPGDELLGLARGFFSAGASSLLVSLWTADDETTATLMQRFYTELHTGATAAAALRAAQRATLAEHEHPFFWAPFVLLGRW